MINVRGTPVVVNLLSKKILLTEISKSDIVMMEG